LSIVSLEDLSFSGLTWTIKLLPRKHTETNICHARCFSYACQRPVYGHIEW